ncbi:MAG: YheU family protein [Deltaproteobacteria bacterium]|nr:YheU family protein [Deltaproteobacteria bacterium]
MPESAVIRVPHDRLDPETLRAVVAEFVTREGTDYGHCEYSADQKIDAVLAQLKNSTAVLVFDEATQSTTIVPSTHPQLARKA